MKNNAITGGPVTNSEGLVSEHIMAIKIDIFLTPQSILQRRWGLKNWKIGSR